MQIQNLQASLFACQNLIAENRFIKNKKDKIEISGETSEREKERNISLS
jgi:hypothetical protein